MKKSSWLWIITLLIILFNLVIYITHIGGDIVLLYVSDSLPVLCSFIASYCLFRAFSLLRQWDFTKLSWLMILIGVSLDFIAEITYSTSEIYLNIDMNEVFPSLADFFWCSAYIFIIIGLGMMFLGYRKSGLPLGKEKIYAILAPLFLVIFVLVVIYLLIPILKDSETSRLSKVFYLYYPIADMLTVIPALILMYITSLFGKGAISMPWRLLAIGFLCFTVGDLLYSYLSWMDIYGNGNFIDVGWNFGYLLIGMAGVYQKELLDSIQGGSL